MDGAPFELVIYRTPGGSSPVLDWLMSLDRAAEKIVRARLNRVRRGLFGDAKSVGGGVWELRIDRGPGYRVYYGREGLRLVVLLGGGQKQGQAKDIKRAQGSWQEHLQRGLL
ncbi:MAG: type II toxin-antitoxin system RelE/ParE family toxin [Elusimicrobia bacterium]|nr:type II toxin-antitoxin system RelE/ParE family toxin [Elusimicrobiota bacterium]